MLVIHDENLHLRFHPLDLFRIDHAMNKRFSCLNKVGSDQHLARGQVNIDYFINIFNSITLIK